MNIASIMRVKKRKKEKEYKIRSRIHTNILALRDFFTTACTRSRDTSETMVIRSLLESGERAVQWISAGRERFKSCRIEPIYFATRNTQNILTLLGEIIVAGKRLQVNLVLT